MGTVLNTGLEAFASLVTSNFVSHFYGSSILRQLFFSRAHITNLFCFENRRGIFPIDSRFKFVLFGLQKKISPETFDAAFMLHDLDALASPENHTVHLSTRLIERFSPETFSIMEFRSQQDLNTITKIYGDYPLLGEVIEGTWKVSVNSEEFHMTYDRSLFNDKGIGWPLYEGKMIYQYTHHFNSPFYWIDIDEGRKELVRREIQRVEARLIALALARFPQLRSQPRQALIEAFLKENGRESLTEEDVHIDADTVRLVFRDVAASTNERAMIATLLPPNIFEGNTLKHLNPWYFDAELAWSQLNDIKSCYRLAIPVPITAYLCGVFNSFPLDYALRFKITNHLSAFYINQLPVPRLTADDPYCRAIARRVARLVCVGSEFDELRRELLGDVDARVIPFEEKEARQRVQNEIDALVAHLYGLSAEDLHHILYAPYTFPLVREAIKDGVMREFARVEQLLLSDE